MEKQDRDRTKPGLDPVPVSPACCLGEMCAAEGICRKLDSLLFPVLHCSEFSPGLNQELDQVLLGNASQVQMVRGGTRAP